MTKFDEFCMHMKGMFFLIAVIPSATFFYLIMIAFGIKESLTTMIIALFLFALQLLGLCLYVYTLRIKR